MGGPSVKVTTTTERVEQKTFSRALLCQLLGVPADSEILVQGREDSDDPTDPGRLVWYPVDGDLVTKTKTITKAAG